MVATDTSLADIMVAMDNTFVTWLEQQINQRGWSIRQTADKAGVSHVHLSNVLNQVRGPGPDFCNAIARALNLPPEMVFRQAGILPPSPDDDDPSLLEALWLLRLLPRDERKSFVAQIRAVAQERKVISQGMSQGQKS